MPRRLYPNPHPASLLACSHIRRAHRTPRPPRPIVYYVFDLLNYAGKDLRYAPLRQRKRMLNAVAKSFSGPVRLAAAVDVNAQTLMAEVKRLGLEGIVAKDPNSIYESGKRSG